jgi:hypothetical protein
MKFQGEDEHGEPIVFNSWRDVAERFPYDQLNTDSLTPEQLEALIAEYKDAVQIRDHGDGIDVIVSADLPLRPDFGVLAFFAARQLRYIDAQQSAARDPFADAQRIAEATLDRLYTPFDGVERTLVAPAPQSDTREYSKASYGWVRIPSPDKKQWAVTAPNFVSHDDLKTMVRTDSLAGRYVIGEIEPHTETWYAVSILISLAKLSDIDDSNALQVALVIAADIGGWAEALRRIHTVIDQCKRRICVAQAVQRAVLTRLGTLEQTSFCEERFEGLTQVLCYRSIRQAKYR